MDKEAAGIWPQITYDCLSLNKYVIGMIFHFIIIEKAVHKSYEKGCGTRSQTRNMLPMLRLSHFFF